MKLKFRYIFLFLTAFAAASCGYKDLPVHNVTQTPAPRPAATEQFNNRKQETPRYVYRGDRFRDPFAPLSGEGTYSAVLLSEEVAVPNLGSLVLKGIFEDSKIKMALISGGGINYILKGTRLYDSRQRLVRGISGIIRKDDVLMIAPDKTTKELKLKSK